METYRINGVFDESLIKMQSLLKFMGQEVEIIIKKRSVKSKRTSKLNFKKAQEITRKYIPENTNLSDELISERRKEFAAE